MPSHRRKSIVFLALVAAVAAQVVPGLGADISTPFSAGPDLTYDEANRVLDLVFGARPHEAIAYLQTLENRAAGEPLFHIIRARCYQEFIPMDDLNHAAARERSAPVLEDLDRCIEVCTRRLESGAGDEKLVLYRGWAWMAKAYVRSMSRDMFSAAREAKKGKKDLEAYLAAHPGDPTASGLLGTFLYFADTIPSAFKFLSKMLLLPTGDRSKGIESLQVAVNGGGLLEIEWKFVLYNIYFYFEGRFEEGLAGLQELSRMYPEHGRTAIPLAVSRPYTPTMAARNDELVEASVERMYGAPHREVDWNALYLVQMFRAYGDRYCSQSRMTEARLRSIIHESPRHPDWLSVYARLELGRLCASRGEREEALALFQTVKAYEGFDQLRKEADILLRDIDKFGYLLDEPPLRDTDEWVRAVYDGSPDSLAEARARFAALAPRSVGAKFYVAECDLLLGKFDAALEGFQSVISVEAPAWDHAYQMLASTRIAEIYAARGYYKNAARYQGIALGYYHNEYLVDWVLEGRKRYFERLADGKESTPPTLLTGNLSGRRDSRRSPAGPAGGVR